MDDLDKALDMILGGFFWLVLLIVVVVFGFGFVKTHARKILPKGPGGGFRSLDGALMDRVYMLGQNQEARRVGVETETEKEAKAALGVRLVLPVGVISVAYFSISDLLDNGSKSTYAFSMEFGIYALLVYLTAYFWAFSMQYDRNTLTMRNQWLMRKKYDLRDLDSITLTQKGTYKLWFDDGQKAEIPKHITNSAGFYRDMRDVIARNVR